jgi:hypothetical protein
MHLTVDNTRKDMQPTAVDGLATLDRAKIADAGDAASDDADITLALAVMVDDGSAFQNHIEGLCHRSSGLAALCEAAYVMAFRKASRPGL